MSKSEYNHQMNVLEDQIQKAKAVMHIWGTPATKEIKRLRGLQKELTAKFN